MTGSTERVRACVVQDVVAGAVVVVALRRVREYIPREVLLTRDESGAIVAYRNECKHLPIPIDGMTRKFFSKDGKQLLCALHGAQYRLSDGYCLSGPCRGSSLDAVPVELVGEEVFVIDALPAGVTPL